MATLDVVLKLLHILALALTVWKLVLEIKRGRRPSPG